MLFFNYSIGESCERASRLDHLFFFPPRSERAQVRGRERKIAHIREDKGRRRKDKKEIKGTVRAHVVNYRPRRTASMNVENVEEEGK